MQKNNLLLKQLKNTESAQLRGQWSYLFHISCISHSRCSRRARHLGLAVLWLKSKDIFQGKIPIKVIYFWVRPIELTYTQSQN